MRIVLTGTDTAVGKTHVACGLLGLLAERAIGIKPIESGCDGSAPEDGHLLAQASGQSHPSQALVRLKAPLAPPLAAELEGVTLDWGEIVTTTRHLCDSVAAGAGGPRRGAGDESGAGFRAPESGPVALVEGAGGLLSPLTWEKSTLDLALELDASVLVVVPQQLGAINHARLTLECLERRGVQLLGVFVNDLGEVDNRAALMRYSKRVTDDLAEICTWIG